jgi:hypothetical protein
MATVRVVYSFRSILIAHAPQEAWQDFNHRDRDAELRSRCGYLEPDLAAADNDKMLLCLEFVGERPRVRLRAQIVNMRRTKQEDRNFAHQRAGRDYQRVIASRRPDAVTISRAAPSMAVHLLPHSNLTSCPASPFGPAIGASATDASSSTAFDSGGLCVSCSTRGTSLRQPTPSDATSIQPHEHMLYIVPSARDILCTADGDSTGTGDNSPSRLGERDK